MMFSRKLEDDSSDEDDSSSCPTSQLIIEDFPLTSEKEINSELVQRKTTIKEMQEKL